MKDDRIAFIGFVAFALASIWAVVNLGRTPSYQSDRAGQPDSSRTQSDVATPATPCAETPRQLALRRNGSVPNIVLITVDTLRADHLGCYGYERPTSPNLDAYAASGVVFEHAISQSPWTLPSLATIHTALYPREHGAVSATSVLPPQATTLAETLSDFGYTTIAVVSQAFAGRRYGLHQGFSVFDETLATNEEGVTSEALTNKLLSLLDSHPCEPLFLWVHYFDPHFNYVHHPEFGFAADYWRAVWDKRITRKHAEALGEDGVEYIEAVYDEEIRYTDEAIGRLILGIEKRDLEHPTVFAFTADHGEYFYERGRYGHAEDVYEPLIHVPLVFFGDLDPDFRGRRIADTVELTNIPRTLASLALFPDSEVFAGADLLGMARGGAGYPHLAYSEGGTPAAPTHRSVMVTDGVWKLIFNLDDERFELYDLRTSPEETENVWDDTTRWDPVVVASLRAEIDAFSQRKTLAAPEIHLTEEERERLRGLGYLQ